jgi:transposase
MEDWVTIRTLRARRPDLGTRAIAELLGIARNTVKSALASERAPQYERTSVINPEIEPFVEFVTDGYLVKHMRVSRILAEMESKGYGGSRSALYRWIETELRPQREAQAAEAFQPYQTRPGEQSLYDWAEYRVPIAESIQRVYVHQSILGYSRYKVFDASLGVHQGDVFCALEDGFLGFDGLTERIQVDNAKVFVDNASREDFRWNGKFLQFCGFWEIKPTRSAPYHPWSKGKVEKPFDHLEAHFIQGERFESFADFLRRLKDYQDRINNTVHSVTHKKPAELYELERKVLRPIPRDPVTDEPKRLVGVAEEVRTVSSDCLVCYGGNRYSVPHPFVRSQVWIRPRKGTTLQLYSQKGKLIATHTLHPGKGETFVQKAHYRGYRKESEQTFEMSAHRLRERFRGTWTRVEEFLISLRAQKRLNPQHHLARMLALFEHHIDADCIQAMENCLHYGCFSAPFLQGILQAARPAAAPPLRLVETPRLRTPTPSVKRDLKEYRL